MAPTQRVPEAPTSSKQLKKWQIDPKKHHAMKIGEADSPRAKFRKATVEAFPVMKPAWATNKVKDLAVFLHANMDKEGRVYKQKSLTEICRILHVSRDLAVRLYRVLELAGVIVRTQAAPGKMAEVSVSPALKALVAEQYGFEVWRPAGAVVGVRRALARETSSAAHVGLVPGRSHRRNAAFLAGLGSARAPAHIQGRLRATLGRLEAPAGSGPAQSPRRVGTALPHCCLFDRGTSRPIDARRWCARARGL